MRLLLITVLCSMTLAQAAPRLIYDGSREGAVPELSATERGRVLELYLRRKIDVCAQDFQVLARVQGRFTSRSSETLYLVQNCYTDFAANPQRERFQGDLWIVRAGRVVFFQQGFSDDLSVLPPLDGGALNFVLVHVYFGPQMGEFARTSTLFRLEGGKARTVMSLGATYKEVRLETQPQTAQVKALFFDFSTPNRLVLREYQSPLNDLGKTSQERYQSAKARLVRLLNLDLRRPPQALD